MAARVHYTSENTHFGHTKNTSELLWTKILLPLRRIDTGRPLNARYEGTQRVMTVRGLAILQNNLVSLHDVPLKTLQNSIN
jgi:hypothetical protein